ncbi:hypothetical protein [Gaetbulibacter jejuensis]|uniref:Peptidase M56 domain-containing protein n=1 Tax=Gaetbulibacter jejuensis TaxID=584607 RepID=A0ABN1JY38_9FLAO|nr:hypothetical protein EVU94_10400 [Flavobacteriaceae bacterium 144Ye]
MILVSKYIVPKGYVGVTIFPFVFLKYKALKEDVVLLNHERIHLQQQIELLIIPFFVIYGFEFLIRLLQYKRWSLAYRNISFEREAYFQEAQLDYLKYRRLYSFLKYL